MKKDSAFVDHLVELLRPMGGITTRYMFGGWGIYKEGLMFALVADGVFYFKTSEVNRPEFEAAGLEQWVYHTDKGSMKMSYHRAPDAALESSAVMVRWARGAYAVALAAAQAKSSKKKALPGKKAASMKKPKET